MIPSFSNALVRHLSLMGSRSLADRISFCAVLTLARQTDSRDTINHLFHSPLGAHINQAFREGDRLHLEFDFPADQLDILLLTLEDEFPRAVVESIRPRRAHHGNH